MELAPSGSEEHHYPSLLKVHRSCFLVIPLTGSYLFKYQRCVRMNTHSWFEKLSDEGPHNGRLTVHV